MGSGHGTAFVRRTRWHHALALAAGLAIASPAALAQQGSNDAAFYAANGLLERGLYDLAIDEYRGFLQANEDSEHADTARYGLAASHAALGQDREAIAALNQLSDPVRFEFAADAGLLRGRSLLRLGDAAGAAATLGGVLELHGDHAVAPEAAALYAEALLGTGDARATARAAQAAAERPQSPSVRQRLELIWGIALVRLGDDNNAASRFSAAYEIDTPGPVREQALLLLAQSLERTGNDEDAAAAYDAVLNGTEDGRTPDALLGAARIHRRAGNDALAASRLDQVLRRYPDSTSAPEAALLRGRIALESGEPDQASELFTFVIQSDANELRDDGVYWAARAARARGADAAAAEALGDFSRFFEDSELVPFADYERASAVWASGDAESAEPLFDAFGNNHGGHALAPDAAHALVQVRHEIGDDEGALEAALAFAEVFPDHPHGVETEFLAAESLFMLSRDTEAADAYSAWLAANSGHEREEAGRFRLGLTLARLGRFQEAEPLLIESAESGQTEAFYRPALLALGDGRFSAGRYADAERPLLLFTDLAEQGEATADASLKLGLARMRLGRPDEAIAPLRQAAEAEGSSDRRAHASYALGRAHAGAGDQAEASRTLESLVESGNSGRFEAFACRELGLLARARGDSRAAEVWFTRAAAAGTGEVAAESALDAGRTLLATGSYTQAAGRLREARRLGSGSDVAPRAVASLVIALARDGSGDAALSLADELTERDQVEPSVLVAMDYELARVLGASGEAERAETLFRSVIAGPDVTLAAYARLELGAAQMDEGDFALASSTIEPLLSDAPDALEEPARYRAGVCAFELGDHGRVVGLLASFYDDFPNAEVGSSADLMCGESLMALNRPSEAVEHLERAASTDAPDGIAEPALLRLGESLATLQYWDRSSEAFNAHLQRFPDSDLWFQSRFGVGWALENSGDTGGAIPQYQTVASRHRGETAARAQFQIGQCLFAENRLEEATRELLKVDILHAYPEWSAAALYEAGRCFEQLGRLAEAREQFRAVTDRFDETEWSNQAQRRLDQMVETAPPGRGR